MSKEDRMGYCKRKKRRQLREYNQLKIHLYHLVTLANRINRCIPYHNCLYIEDGYHLHAVPKLLPQERLLSTEAARFNFGARKMTTVIMIPKPKQLEKPKLLLSFWYDTKYSNTPASLFHRLPPVSRDENS